MTVREVSSTVFGPAQDLFPGFISEFLEMRFLPLREGIGPAKPGTQREVQLVPARIDQPFWGMFDGFIDRFGAGDRWLDGWIHGLS